MLLYGMCCPVSSNSPNLRYYRGKTQTEIAKILNTSQVQISRIEKRALQAMKKKLTEDVVLY